MYQVSEECRAILNSSDRETDFRCEVTLLNGNEITIGSNLIKNGSVYVKTKCVSGSDFELGAVCVGEFGVDLLDDSLDSRNYEGAVIRPFCCIKLSDGSFEDIPMGVFNVTEISCPDNHTTKLVCYDNMIKFDKEYEPINPEGTYVGVPVSLVIGRITQKCGVSISDENHYVISSMANGTEVIGFAEAAPCNKDIQTFRDILTMITQLLGGCAVMDREGCLKIINFDRQYSEEYPSYAAIIGHEQRKSTNIKNIKKFEAVSILLTGLVGSARYTYPPETASSNILMLDDNPYLRLSSDSYVLSFLKEIAERLPSMTYYGAETEIFGDPTIDVGDHLLLTGGTAGQGVRILVTTNDWTYRGSHKITSAASVTQAKASKNTAVSGGGSSDTPSYAVLQKQYIYNLPPVFITTGSKRICRIGIIPTDFNTPVKVSGQIRIDMILPGVVTISSNLNGQDTGISTQQYLPKGKHTLEIMLPFNTSEIKLHAIDLFITCSHGHGESISSDCGSADCDIAVCGYVDEPTIEPFGQCVTRINFRDTTVAEIPAVDLSSVQVGKINWGDGTIEEYAPSQSYSHTYSEAGDYVVSIDCYIEKFKCKGNISVLILAESVKEIDSGAFAQCSLLGVVHIPPRVKKIGHYAFVGTAIKNVVLSYDCVYQSSSFPEDCAVMYYPYLDEPNNYSSGEGINITGNIISLTDVINGGTVGSSVADTPVFGGGFPVPWFEYNNKGQIIGAGNKTVVLPSYTAGTGLEISGKTFNHSNSIAAADVGRFGGTQTIRYNAQFTMPWFSFDDCGHVTGKGQSYYVIESADFELNSTSSKPVQNKTIKAALDKCVKNTGDIISNSEYAGQLKINRTSASDTGVLSVIDYTVNGVRTAVIGAKFQDDGTTMVHIRDKNNQNIMTLTMAETQLKGTLSLEKNISGSTDSGGCIYSFSGSSLGQATITATGIFNLTSVIMGLRIKQGTNYCDFNVTLPLTYIKKLGASVESGGEFRFGVPLAYTNDAVRNQFVVKYVDNNSLTISSTYTTVTSILEIKVFKYI